MSASVESRIVSMKFDNAAFNKAAQASMGVLAKLKSSLDSLGGAKGLASKANPLNTLQAAANGFSMAKASAETNAFSAKMVALGTIGVTTLANITNQALATGTALAKSLTIEPLSTGFHEYEKGIKSVQTILSNTKASGAGLDDVNAALDELNTYADQTIYNFGEMTRNIGTFTAAGVDLELATASIKGIANIAAMSGSTSQQAATAMYQLSQAISAGKVGLMDWNSVVNAGMGGAVFQRALAQTAVAMGTIDESALKLTGKMKNVTIEGQSFRNSIMAAPGKESWLTSDVLTSTLENFTGDMTEAQLIAKGFSKEVAKSIMEQADSAVTAATKIKTLTQLIDTSKEIAGSGWALTWRYVFGDYSEAKRSFSKAGAVITGMIDANAKARNAIIADWKELGGRKQLIKGIMNVWEALGSILGPIRDAFRDVFPPATGNTLLAITAGFRQLARWMVLGEENGHAVRQVFRSIFTVLKLVLSVIGGLIFYFADLIALIIQLAAPFFRLAAAIIDVVYQLGEFAGAGDGISGLFKALIEGRRAVLEPIIEAITSIVDAFTALITGGPKAFAEALGDIPGAVAGAFKAVLGAIGGVFSGIGTFLGNLLDKLGPIGAIIKGFGQGIVDGFQGAWNAIKTFASSAFGPILDIFGSFGNIEGPNVGGMFGGLTESLKPIIDFFKVDFVQGINNAFGALIPYAQRAGEAVAKAIGWIMEKAVALFNYLLPLTAYIGIAFDATVRGLIAAWEIIKSFSQSVMDAVGGFEGIGDALSAVGDIFMNAVNGVKDFFGNIDLGFDKSSPKIEQSVSILDRITGALDKVVNGLKDGALNVGDFFAAIPGIVATGVKYALLAIAAPFYGLYLAIREGFGLLGDGVGDSGLWERVSPILEGLKEKITEFFAQLTFQDVLALVNTAFFIMLYRTLNNFIKAIEPLGGALAKFVDVFTDSMEKFTESMTGLIDAQAIDLKAAAIKKIAFALLIIVAAIYLLSLIPPKQIAQGVATMAALLFILSKFIGALEANPMLSPKAVLANAASLSIIAVGIGILGFALIGFALALRIFGQMDREELIQGTIALAVILTGLTVMINKIAANGPAMIYAAIGIAILSGALILFAQSIKYFANMDPTVFVHGMIAIALIMQVLTNTLGKMGPGMVQAAFGIVIVAGALILMSKALEMIGSLPLETLAKGVITVAIMLILISETLIIMTSAVPAAQALFIVAAALVVLGVALALIGNLPIKVIAIAIGAIAAALIVLGLIVYVMVQTGVIVGLVALGYAILSLGIGALAAGAGMFLFAAALASLAVSGAAGFAVLIAGAVAFAEIIPLLAQQFGLGLIAIAEVISESGPVLIEAMYTVLEALGQAIIKFLPTLEKLIRKLLSAIINILVSLHNDVSDAMVDLLLAMMKRITENIPEFAKRARELGVAFIDALAKEIPIFVDRVYRAVIKLMNDLADTIQANSEEVGRAGARLAGAIVRGFLSAIGGFADTVFDAVIGLLPSIDDLQDALGGLMDAVLPGGNGRFIQNLVRTVENKQNQDKNEDKPSNGGKGALLDRTENTTRSTKESLIQIATRVTRALAENIDTSPIITPVLDLSQIKLGAVELSDILKNASMDTSNAYTRARVVAADVDATVEARNAATETSGGDEYNYHQTITSPKPIDPVEVYRDTKSLLALTAKGP